MVLPVRLQLFAVLVLLAFLAWVVVLIRRHQLSLRDSLAWFLSTFAALVVTIFPRTLVWVSRALGIDVPSNALFAIAFLYVLWNMLALTLTASSSAVRIRRLSQECALLRAQLDERDAAMVSEKKQASGDK